MYLGSGKQKNKFAGLSINVAHTYLGIPYRPVQNQMGIGVVASPLQCGNHKGEGVAGIASLNQLVLLVTSQIWALLAHFSLQGLPSRNAS
jgi:hypothetical protein